MIGNVNQPSTNQIMDVDGTLNARSGAYFEARSGATWDAATKILTIPAYAYIFHGRASKYLKFENATITINFSTFGASQMAYAYVYDVTPAVSQLAHPVSKVLTESAGFLTHNLNAADVYILAMYSPDTGIMKSPFFELGAPPTFELDSAVYEARSGISWNTVTKVLSIPQRAYIYHGGTKKYLRFEAADIEVDYSGYSVGTTAYTYVENVTPYATQTDHPLSNIRTENLGGLTRNLSDPDIRILATYTPGNDMLLSPFFPSGTPDQSDSYALDTWHNLYPQISSKLAIALAKMLAPTADFKIVLWGDSILARETHTSAGSIDPTALPPGLITRNIAWYLWDQLPMRKGLYRRYDYTGAYFTETGLWATSLTGDNTANGGPDTNWDDEGDRPAYTRISDAATAAFAWTLGVTDEESGCNLIYRTDTAGDAAATIAVTEGDGYLEYWNGSSWAEANAATFSMLESDEGARRGNTVYNKRLKLRKTTAHENDSVTVTVGKATADGDRLLYWGVELYDEINGKFIPRLVNSARGSHTLNTGAANIYDYMDDDVLDQDPDLVIFEIPLLNMISGSNLTTILNSVQDVIWGDRAGATNTWNLKSISSDWADFQVLVVIPHHSQSHYTVTTNAYVEQIANIDQQEIYNAVKALIIGKNDVAMIDMATAFEREIDASEYEGDYYVAMNGSSTTGTTYTNDDVHQNDRGTLVYAKHLCPTLDGSSY